MIILGGLSRKRDDSQRFISCSQIILYSVSLFLNRTKQPKIAAAPASIVEVFRGSHSASILAVVGGKRKKATAKAGNLHLEARREEWSGDEENRFKKELNNKLLQSMAQ